MAEREAKEQAQFKAYLRAKRGYEKKLQDIDWNYDTFVPLLEEYKAGRLKLDFKKPAFELEMGNAEDHTA